jgi:hypothetical protein
MTSTLFPLFLSPHLSELVLDRPLQRDSSRYYGLVAEALTRCQHLRLFSVTIFNTRNATESSIEFNGAITALNDWLKEAPAIEDLTLAVPKYLSPLTIRLLSVLSRLKSLSINCSGEILISSVNKFFETARFVSLRHLQLVGAISVAKEFTRFKLS